MARIFLDNDADLSALDGRRVGILGYGNQGRSQALNLRDSGVEVLVGSPGDSSGERAREDGFEVLPVAEITAAVDVLCLLIPDEVMAKVYATDIAPALTAGKTLSFAHGYNIAFKKIVPPDDVDVIMVAPRMIGKGVRDTFLEGQGFPSLVAVAQDATGKALETALAFAKAIGSTRMGAVESSFEEETTIDIFSEHASELHRISNAFEALTEAGFDPDVVLLELYGSGERGEIAKAMVDEGLWVQMRLHSRTSQFGQLVIAPGYSDPDTALDRYRKIIAHIKSGDFTKEWDAEQEAGLPQLKAAYDDRLTRRMQETENRLYEVLGRRDEPVTHADWLDETERQKVEG